MRFFNFSDTLGRVVKLLLIYGILLIKGLVIKYRGGWAGKICFSGDSFLLTLP